MKINIKIIMKIIIMKIENGNKNKHKLMATIKLQKK